MSTTVIPVTTPTGGYDVQVGRGLLAEVGDLVPDRVRRIVVVHQPSLRAVAEELREQLSTGGKHAFLAEVPDGEEAKTAQVAGFLEHLQKHGVQSRSVARKLSCLRGFYKWLLLDKRIGHDPTVNLDLLQRSSPFVWTASAHVYMRGRVLGEFPSSLLAQASVCTRDEDDFAGKGRDVCRRVEKISCSGHVCG